MTVVVQPIEAAANLIGAGADVGRQFDAAGRQYVLVIAGVWQHLPFGTACVLVSLVTLPACTSDSGLIGALSPWPQPAAVLCFTSNQKIVKF